MKKIHRKIYNEGVDDARLGKAYNNPYSDIAEQYYASGYYGISIGTVKRLNKNTSAKIKSGYSRIGLNNI